MGLLNQIERGIKKPHRVMLYGTHGIGKSTFASMAPSPIFIQIEDGLASVDCDAFPKSEKLAHVMEAIGELYQGEHQYKTVVIDTLDWLERLIWSEVCEAKGVKNIEDIGYGKGYTMALDYWRRITRGLDALRNDRGMGSIVLAHAAVVTYNAPDTEPYDRYQPKLHKSASALMQEWADDVLFASFKTFTRATGDEAKGKQRGVGTGERVIYTAERPAYYAKNRLPGIPQELPLDYRVFAEHLPKSTTPAVAASA
jgi:hypothetical protein